MNPVETLIVKNQKISESESIRVATINRFPLKSRTYKLTQASETRLLAASHGRYTSRYPYRDGGWKALIHISDDKLRSYYQSL